jgi:hypothetical protein
MFTIFGAALNPATGKWQVFDDETFAILSEHPTEHAALAACRYYTECQMLRASGQAAVKSVQASAPGGPSHRRAAACVAHHLWLVGPVPGNV